MKIKDHNRELELKAGVGATEYIGSDTYGYRVVDVDDAKKIVYLLEHHGHFDDTHPWYGGEMVNNDMDMSNLSKSDATLAVQLFRNKWYRYDMVNNKRICGYHMKYLTFGVCNNYRDPSF